MRLDNFQEKYGLTGTLWSALCRWFGASPRLRRLEDSARQGRQRRTEHQLSRQGGRRVLDALDGQRRFRRRAYRGSRTRWRMLGEMIQEDDGHPKRERPGHAPDPYAELEKRGGDFRALIMCDHPTLLNDPHARRFALYPMRFSTAGEAVLRPASILRGRRPCGKPLLGGWVKAFGKAVFAHE